MFMRRMFPVVVCAAALFGAALIAQEQASVAALYARPIEPPTSPLPAEDASAGVTKFSFFAYGDSRSGNVPGVPGDGMVLNVEHTRLMDFMLAKIENLATTPFPVRFVVQSGDGVLRGANRDQWDVSFSPIIERLTRRAGLPFFFAVGNHDVTGLPTVGDPGREPGLRNALMAMSKLMPPAGSPRRLSGYPTYGFGYGNLFAIALDSNIAADPVQLAWVTDQLQQLNRARYRHVIAFFHHPPFSSGPHGGPNIEPSTATLRDLYMPLFRRHHVRMIITGHEHLYEHWIERYVDKGASYRMDQLVSGGGGAPLYVYSSEPDLRAYRLQGAAERVELEHVIKPGPTAADNPRHFVVIQVDGDRLSLEVVGSGVPYAPYNGRSRIDLTDRVS
jgi:calcineurin-like phosphoesterase family protein